MSKFDQNQEFLGFQNPATNTNVFSGSNHFVPRKIFNFDKTSKNNQSEFKQKLSQISPKFKTEIDSKANFQDTSLEKKTRNREINKNKLDEYYESYRNQEQIIYQQKLYDERKRFRESLEKLKIKNKNLEQNLKTQAIPSLSKTDIILIQKPIPPNIKNINRPNSDRNREFVETSKLVSLEQARYFRQKAESQRFDKNLFDEHEEQIRKQELEESKTEKYYSKTLFLAIIGIILYYVGASLLIFFDNASGVTKVTLKTYDLSWQLAFSNFGQYLANIVSALFGYFIQYGRLFGFFVEKGDLASGIVAKPKYLMPVDIIIKALTIGYFHFRWMGWDILQSFSKNFFNSKYPYLDSEQKMSKEQNTQKSQELEDEDDSIMQVPANIKAHVSNIYHDSPVIHIQESISEPSNLGQNLNKNGFLDFQDDDDDEDDIEHNFLPFYGVHKPIEEFYQKHEQKIYNIIRKNILPGSNLILVFYFSSLNVLGFDYPIGVLQYMLGIMSMFWCMQSFVVVLDHNQFPPEEDLD